MDCLHQDASRFRALMLAPRATQPPGAERDVLEPAGGHSGQTRPWTAWLCRYKRTLSCLVMTTGRAGRDFSLLSRHCVAAVTGRLSVAASARSAAWNFSL